MINWNKCTKPIAGEYNKDVGIKIRFTSDGLGKMSEARRIGRINAAAVQILMSMLEHAEYSNMGQRKATDKEKVLDYLNFKAKVKIDDKTYHFRMAVKLKTDMKAYLNTHIRTPYNASSIWSIDTSY